MSKKINFIHDLQLIVAAGLKGIGTISEEELKAKPNPSKWSKIEILGHLVDSAYNNHQRFLRGQSQDNLVFNGYNQDEWVKINNYQNRDKSLLLSFWVSVNVHLVNSLQDFDEKLFEKKHQNHNFHEICMNTIDQASLASLDYLLWDYNFHMEHHLSQIIDGYTRLLEPYDAKLAKNN